MSKPILNRISANPSPQTRRIVAVAVVVEVGLGVVVLRGEAVGEEVGHVAVFVDRVPEGVVGVLGDEFAILVPVADHVAVVVVARKVEVAVDADGDEAAHAAGALQGPRQVWAPEVFDFRFDILVGVVAVLVDQVPAVVDEDPVLGNVEDPAVEPFGETGRPAPAPVVVLQRPDRVLRNDDEPPRCGPFVGAAAEGR